MPSPRGVVDVKIWGNPEASRRMLESVMHALNPLILQGWLTTVMQPWINRRTATRFQREGDEASGKWAPLRESTVQFREQAGFPGEHPINVRTGALYNFVTTSADVYPTAYQAVLAIPSARGGTPELIEKLTTAQIGKTHPATVPRPVLALDVRDMAFALTSLAAWVETATRSNLGIGRSSYGTINLPGSGRLTV